MKVQLYSIYDSKAGAYLQPFFAPNAAVAFRVIEKSMKNPQSGFSDFPSDFNLFEIGEFDAVQGVLLPAQPAPKSLGNLLQFVPAEPPASLPSSLPLPDSKVA